MVSDRGNNINYFKMKTKYLSIFFILFNIFFLYSCSKKYKVIETKSYSFSVDKLSLLGVNYINLDYNEFERSAIISFNAISKIVLGKKLNLNEIKFYASFSKNGTLDKIELVDNPLIYFTISNEEIKYSFNSREMKNIQIKSIANSTIDLTEKERMLCLIYTSLFQDLIGFQNKENESKFKFETVKYEKLENNIALLSIGCYTIGGSESSVQARLSECSKEGCTVIGKDISCLWGKHACLGSVTFYCPTLSTNTSTEDIPHFFWD
jgi:hypothetical protein